MNIFFLSMSIKRCAKYHFDKHVVKMIIEYCQLLSTAWHMLDSKDAGIYLEKGLIYRKTHHNHPSAIWTREHINNYMYVAKLALELCKEWRYRYNHDVLHGCEEKLLFLLNNPPLSINTIDIPKTSCNPKQLSLPLPQAMPDEYKSNKGTIHGVIKAYRRYYKSEEKAKLVSWTVKNNTLRGRDKIDTPEWW